MPPSTSTWPSSTRLRSSSVARNGFPAVIVIVEASAGPGGAPTCWSTSVASWSGSERTRTQAAPVIIGQLDEAPYSRRCRLRSGGDDQQQAERLRPCADRPQCLEAGVVGPLDVVGHEHQPPGADASLDRGEAGVDRVIVWPDVRQRREQPPHQHEWPVSIRLDGSRVAHGRLGRGQELGRRREQGGLADAGLSLDAEEPPDTLSEATLRIAHRPEFHRPPHETGRHAVRR